MLIKIRIIKNETKKKLLNSGSTNWKSAMCKRPMTSGRRLFTVRLVGHSGQYPSSVSGEKKKIMKKKKQKKKFKRKN